MGAITITETLFSHWLAVAEAAEETPSKGHPDAHALTVEAMGFLISSYWVRGEASDLHIHVSAAKVRRRFNSTRKQQFPHRRAFLKFLKQTRQTTADLLLRVELNLLSDAIQRHVAKGHHGAGTQRALSRFVTGFRKKWKERTYCKPAYAMDDCGHVQELS